MRKDYDGVKCVLLDIEGTTSSVSYVYDVHFPWVRTQMRRFVEEHWDDPAVRKACEHLALDAGVDSFEVWTNGLTRPEAVEKVVVEVYRLMDADSKSGGLKEIQGLVSREGYATGALRSHFYPDVPRVLETLTKSGVRCCVYSSGSVEAQKSFFTHAECGDLSRHISANFDTAIGPKREVSSYAAIAEKLFVPPREIVFCSDVLAEVEAARTAGLRTALVVRPGNKAVLEAHTHPVLRSLDELL